MGAAVDDVHHRHRQLARAAAAEVLIQRQPGGVCGGVGHRQRDGEDGVGAERPLVVGAVGVDHGLVDPELIAGVETLDGLGDGAVDVLDGAKDALAEISVGISVAKLEGLAGSGRSARRHDGVTHGAAGEQDFGLDGRVAA